MDDQKKSYFRSSVGKYTLLKDPKKPTTQLANESFGNRNLVGIKSKSNMAWLEIENGHIEGRHNATGKKGRVFVYTRKRGS